MPDRAVTWIASLEARGESGDVARKATRRGNRASAAASASCLLSFAHSRCRHCRALHLTVCVLSNSLHQVTQSKPMAPIMLYHWPVPVLLQPPPCDKCVTHLSETAFTTRVRM